MGGTHGFNKWGWPVTSASRKAPSHHDEFLTSHFQIWITLEDHSRGLKDLISEFLSLANAQYWCVTSQQACMITVNFARGLHAKQKGYKGSFVHYCWLEPFHPGNREGICLLVALAHD